MVRLGVNYKQVLYKGGWFQLRFFPYESDETGTQLSVVAFFKIASGVKILGFADYNINKVGESRWVSEWELDVQIVRGIDIIAEGRYNGFEDANPKLEGAGVAFGARIQF